MQNKWYGDKRDLVKWGTLVHLAGDDPNVRILQVLMLRPDNQRDSLLTEGDYPISARVFDHFRRVTNVCSLDSRIMLYDTPFPEHNNGNHQERREQYFQGVCSWIKRFQHTRRVVLVDPDTGISRNPGWSHVGPKELNQLYNMLSCGDMLILYQHSQRRQHWLDITRQQFADAIKIGTDKVRVFQCCELAFDVVLFAVENEPKDFRTPHEIPGTPYVVRPGN